MVYLLSQTIDRAAERAEHADAFRSEDRRLTYGEIVDRANRLANLLVEEGVRRGDRVGIFMPRCLESAIAVYGIMKAGAAFVPLDIPHGRRYVAAVGHRPGLALEPRRSHLLLELAVTGAGRSATADSPRRG
jgi:non-ribosomal peptide synthetase component F